MLLMAIKTLTTHNLSTIWSIKQAPETFERKKIHWKNAGEKPVTTIQLNSTT